jgi:hypothetical protein
VRKPHAPAGALENLPRKRDQFEVGIAARRVEGDQPLHHVQYRIGIAHNILRALMGKSGVSGKE